MTYHPLETVLVDVPTSGDWRQDVATALGVDAQWVIGFLLHARASVSGGDTRPAERDDR